MPLPREHYIPIPKARLHAALLGPAPDAEQAAVFRLAEALLAVRWQPTLEELKADYELFSPETGAAARVGLDEAELLARQRRFLGNFLLAMRRANFLPFEAEEQRLAFDSRYLFDVPAEVDWSVLDPEPAADLAAHLASEAGRPLAARLELGPAGLQGWLRPSPELGQNALVFHRGMGPDRAEGRYLMERLDLLAERLLRLLTFPVLVPLQWLIELVRGESHPAPPPRARAFPEPRRWVRRVNVRNLPLFTAPRWIRLQEPAFRHLVTVFRLEPPPGSRLLSADRLLRARSSGEFALRADAAPAQARDWTLWLQLFRQIPLADSEIVFPEMFLKLRSFDLALLIVTAVAAIPTLVQTWVNPRRAVYAVGVALGLTVWRLIARTLEVRRAYRARVTRDLYSKHLDTSVGVLHFLIDGLEEQELEEALLVWTLLLRAEAPLSAAELDERVERWLEREHAADVDLEVEDALRKVVAPGPLPIVEELPGEPPRYRALPPAAARAALEERWRAWPGELGAGAGPA
ncbi:MAG: DUF3754 domain-containing protein [Planctomycetota bacterium]